MWWGLRSISPIEIFDELSEEETVVGENFGGWIFAEIGR
jgi:hypothetical protein